MSVDVEKDDSTRQQAGNRRLAHNAPEARLQTKHMHTRGPAWKLPLCIQALNARPIDLAHVAEVTEILFASSDLTIINDVTQSASGPAEGETQDVESESTEHDGSEEDADQSYTQEREGESSEAVYGKDQEGNLSHEKPLTSVPHHRIQLNRFPQLRPPIRVPQHQHQ